MKLIRTNVTIYFILLFGCSKQQLSHDVIAQNSQKLSRLQDENLTSKPVSQISKQNSQSNEQLDKSRVAVLDLQNRAKLEEESVNYLSSLLRQAASRLPSQKYSVMTRDNLQVMLPPEVKIEDCQGSCAVDTGRKIGAQWVLTGEVINFGDELRITLSLHHSQSGELRGSEMVKGSDLRSLEGPLQGTAMGLFSALDPSLKTIAERLKRGFVFEKFNYSRIPDLSEKLKQLSEDRIEEISLPKPQIPTTQIGVDFGQLDIVGLEIYDKAVRVDKDKSSTPEEKIEQWLKVSSKVPKLKEEADKRIMSWRLYLKQLADKKAAEMRKREEKLMRRRSAIQHLETLIKEDENQALKRRQQMEKDFSKLTRLLRLDIVSRSDKLSWVDAFLESYGAIQELNPYALELSEWGKLLRNRYDNLITDSKSAYQQQLDREAKIRIQLKQIRNEIKHILKQAGDDEIKETEVSPERKIEPSSHLMTLVEVNCSNSNATIWINGQPQGSPPVMKGLGLAVKRAIFECRLGSLVARKSMILRHGEELEIYLDLDQVLRKEKRRIEEQAKRTKFWRDLSRGVGKVMVTVAGLSLVASGVTYLNARSSVDRRDLALERLNDSTTDMFNEVLAFRNSEQNIREANNRSVTFLSISSLSTILGITAFWLSMSEEGVPK